MNNIVLYLVVVVLSGYGIYKVFPDIRDEFKSEKKSWGRIGLQSFIFASVGFFGLLSMYLLIDELSKEPESREQETLRELVYDYELEKYSYLLTGIKLKVEYNKVLCDRMSSWVKGEIESELITTDYVFRYGRDCGYWEEVNSYLQNLTEEIKSSDSFDEKETWYFKLIRTNVSERVTNIDLDVFVDEFDIGLFKTIDECEKFRELVYDYEYLYPRNCKKFDTDIRLIISQP